MAQFRRNHSKQSNPFGRKIILLTVVLAVGIVFLALWILQPNEMLQSVDDTVKDDEYYFLPKGASGNIYCKESFCLAYGEEYEQALWVAYRLTKDQMKQKRFPRPDDFREDASIRTGSAVREDFRRSGYTRGHLVPAADRSYDESLLRETFLYSNISPQLYEYNGAVWRELEENVRDWAYKFEELYVYSGPAFAKNPRRIGPNRVAVPEAFWKVILDIRQPEIKAVAFWIPHQKQTRRLSEFVISIDELEDRLGYNFLDGFVDPRLEASLESRSDPDLWPLKEKRYLQRINEWNPK